MLLTMRLLGRFEVAAPSGDVLKISGTRTQLLLARLSLSDGQRLERGVLSAMLWGDRADAQARASLRQMIWTLRQALDPYPGALVVDGDALLLDPRAIGSDVAEFDRCATSSEAVDLERALALYRGDLLDGVDLIALDPDGYFQHQRTRLRDLALRCTRSLVEVHGQNRHWDDAVRVARRGLVLDPYDQTLNASLVQGLQAMGRYREARDRDDTFRRMMVAELGLPQPPQPLGPPAPSPRPAIGVDVVPARPQPQPRRDLRRLAVAAAVLVVAAGIGIAQFVMPRPSEAKGPSAPIGSALPTANLQAYDLYLRAESLRLKRDGFSWKQTPSGNAFERMREAAFPATMQTHPTLAAAGDSQLHAAMAVYQRATDLDPGFTEAHAGYAMAAVTIAQRRFDALLPADASRNQAYVAAGLALQRDPENAHALIVLSRLQAQDGAMDTALISAKRAVLSRPDDAEARANLALLLSRTGQAFLARAELAHMRQLDPVPGPDDIVIYGELAFAEGRYGGAIADFVAAWPDLPHDQVLLTHLIAALAIQGQLGQAQTVLKDFLAAQPEANLHQLFMHYSAIRQAGQNQRLLDGLRRAGLPVWSRGDDLSTVDRLAGADLAALVGQVPGSDQQYLRGDEVCRIEDFRSVCGSIFPAPPGRGVEFVFLAPTEIRFFSGPKK